MWSLCMINSMLAVAVAGWVEPQWHTWGTLLISRKDTTITRIMISYTGLSTFDHILANLRCLNS